MIKCSPLAQALAYSQCAKRRKMASPETNPYCSYCLRQVPRDRKNKMNQGIRTSRNILKSKMPKSLGLSSDPRKKSTMTLSVIRTVAPRTRAERSEEHTSELQSHV